MVHLLSKFFIEKNDALSEEKKRERYGVLCSIIGIALNILLFAGKITAGLLAGAISIIADAFNNLTDAGSSCLTLFGFKLAGQKPDTEHPFGHGRFEYISGLLVSMVIILVGFELGKSSVEKIITPEPITFSFLSVGILAASILVKFYMAYYNRKIGKKIHSSAMLATALDSISDCIATLAVLFCMILTKISDLQIDAYCGLAVSAFILYSGVRSARETISPLLGQPPTEALVCAIEEIVMTSPFVTGIHDLVVHDYGPGRMMISLHAEVPCHEDLLKIHDSIDNVEKMLREKLSCEAVIHMDPVETNDETVIETKAKITALVKILDERISIHDFRMVRGETHTNVIFDAVVPFSVPMTEKEAKAKIEALVHTMDPHYFAVVEIDKAMIR